MINMKGMSGLTIYEAASKLTRCVNEQQLLLKYATQHYYSFISSSKTSTTETPCFFRSYWLFRILLTQSDLIMS